jgi:hypothetical protein
MAGHVVYPVNHPLMKDATRIRGHALAALAHVAASIESLRRQDLSQHGLMLRQLRLIVQGAMRDLELRYRELADLYAAPASQVGRDAATTWQRFFKRYDDFLHALRRARLQIAEARDPFLVHA